MPRLTLLFAVMTLLVLKVRAVRMFTYPVKSINLQDAAKPTFYVGFSGDATLQPAEDLHPVHGIECADGGFVLVGKAAEGGGASAMEGFAVKFSASGTKLWSWKSGVTGDDAINAVAQLSNGDVLVVGWRKVGSVGRRSVTKLNVATGAEVWTMTDFGDSAGSHGAFEMITTKAGADHVILTGVKEKPNVSWRGTFEELGAKLTMSVTESTMAAG